MLSANEFTVGSLVNAQKFSLMLPRNRYEQPFLIGELNNLPMAVFLTQGNATYSFIECSKGDDWKGILIPNVGFEVDETSIFDPKERTRLYGSLERIDERLTIKAKKDEFLSSPQRVTLVAGLPSSHGGSAGFSKWRIVIGEGQSKRVLWSVDLSQSEDQ